MRYRHIHRFLSARVIAREDSGHGRQLVAYIVAGESTLDEESLRHALSEKLPDYMVPSAFVVMDKLPLTANGKLDRRALPAPTAQAKSYRAPRTRQEEILCGIFAEVLSLERAGIDDNFFYSGGDSILSIQLVSRARKSGLLLTPRDVFQNPTVELLALAAKPMVPTPDLSAPNSSVNPKLSAQERAQLQSNYPGFEDVLPLSPLQQGLLFHALYDTTAIDAYTLQLCLELEGPLDTELLKTAWMALIQRHSNLRAAFAYQGLAHPVQVIHKQTELLWREKDFSVSVVQEQDFQRQEQAKNSFLAEERSKAFDVTKAPLIRFALLRRERESHLLAITHHHLLLDGWSMPVLIRELLHFYRGSSDQVQPVRPYSEYLAWLATQDKPAALKAWRHYLEGMEEATLISPATDAALPSRPEYLLTYTEAEVARKLQALARKKEVTLSSLLQALWAVLLAKLTGREDVAFGITVSGRPPELPDVERMVGMFINTVPLRVRLSATQTFSDLLAEVQQSQSQMLPFHYVGLAEIQAESGFGKLFDTLVVFENYPLERASLTEESAGLRITGAEAWDTVHYPLGLIVVPGERLELRLSYDTARFTEQDAQTVVSRFLHLLETVATSP